MFEKLVTKFKQSITKKSNGDGNLLVACLLVVAGIIIAQIIWYSIRNAGVQIHTTLNSRIEATALQNTWIH